MGNSTQSNVPGPGPFTLTAAGTCTGGYCGKLDTAGKAVPVTAKADRALFVFAHDAASGDQVTVIPLSPGNLVRIKAGTVSGTQNAGVKVYLASANDGRINEASSSATLIGFALQQFVTGDLVLVLPVPAS